MARILSIVTEAYRATVEEQDDTVLWFTSMCGTAGLDVSVLLRGNAVNYAVRGHDASGLRFGAAGVQHPAVLDADLADLVAKGVEVHYVREDLAERGVDEARLIDGVERLKRGELARLLADFDQVWHW